MPHKCIVVPMLRLLGERHVSAGRGELGRLQGRELRHLHV